MPDTELSAGAMSEPVRAARVERQRLKFAAAHMATFADTMEPLHGHNYAVTIEAVGTLAREGWVLDFGTLKRIGRDLCDGLDHHFLLQSRSTQLSITRDADFVEIRFGARRYVIPRQDVFELPLANTTAELIAEWLWSEVVAHLRTAGAENVTRLSIGVEEAPGQTGWYTGAVPPGG